MWCFDTAKSLIPGLRVLQFHEDDKLRLHYDEEMLKLGLQICLNSKWAKIPTPDELAAYPSLWLEDLFRLNKEVTRQYDILVGSQED